jgi:hypothetical protein
VVVVLGGLLGFAFASSWGTKTGRTEPSTETVSGDYTLIDAGAQQALTPKMGIPMCYDVPFSLSKEGTLSGTVEATGLVNWYVLSTSGGPPLSATIVSGSITQVLPPDSYVLEFCNQQKSTIILTFVGPLVVSYD